MLAKRISSTDWTGPPDQTSRRGAFVHRAGQHSIASDYQRFLAARIEAEKVPPEVQRIRICAALLLLSPLMLWLAWGLVETAIGHPFDFDHRDGLVAWGLGVAAIAAWQLASRSRVLVDLRRAFLFAMLAATAIVSILFAYAGINAGSRGIAGPPERTFEMYKFRGKGAFKRMVTLHQRPDGSIVEGGTRKRPLAYSSGCALVQRFESPNGFHWVKVLDRSRSPARGQLSWPIRREECFSNIPLSSLPS